MKKIIYALIGLVVLVGVYLSTRWFQQEKLIQSELNDRSRLIFCERLQKGMSKKDVLEILSEYGDFKYGESDSGGRTSEIFGNYADYSIIGEATVHLVFLDEKYNAAYTKIFDQGKSVCDLQ
jgi:hypothetical protein